MSLMYERLKAIGNLRMHDDADFVKWMKSVDAGYLKITTDGPFWQPDETGTPAWIISEWDGAWAPRDPALMLCDLIAYTCHDAKYYTRNGVARALGEWDLGPSMSDGAPLMLWSTPLQWLKHGRKGCFILDWRACYCDLLTRRKIIVDTTEFAATLDGHLRAARTASIPSMPPIGVRL